MEIYIYYRIINDFLNVRFTGSKMFSPIYMGGDIDKGKKRAVKII